ncbi:unnamed protein product [Sphacelaria rigidula]
MVARAEAEAAGGGYRMRGPRPAAAASGESTSSSPPTAASDKKAGNSGVSSPGSTKDTEPAFSSSSSTLENDLMSSGVALEGDGIGSKKGSKKKKKAGAGGGTGEDDNGATLGTDIPRSPLEASGVDAFLEREEQRKADRVRDRKGNGGVGVDVGDVGAAEGDAAADGKKARKDRAEVEVSYDSVINIETMPALEQQEQVSFRDLGIKNDVLLANVKALGIKTPTDVQISAIQGVVSQDKDVIIHAYTGSGKTLAYLLPLIDAMDPQSNGVQAVVVAPGRELASQISSVCDKLIEGLGIRSAMIIGGANAQRQVEKVKKVKPQVRW